MIQTARKIIAEDYMVVDEGTYWDPYVRRDCKAYFSEMRRDGKVKSCYEDSKWQVKDGVEPCSISFDLSKKAYVDHAMKYISISFDDVVEAMKVYTIWHEGDYTFRGLQARIRTIKKMLEKLGEKRLSIGSELIFAIKDFLVFVGIETCEIKKVMKRIKIIERPDTAPRELQPVLTYLVAADKSRKIMAEGTREEKLKWFSTYLVTNLGLNIPLRPTGFSILPYNCVTHDENGYTLTLRRTDLKKGKGNVTHDINGDYKLCSYSVPYTEVIQMIEWYAEETKDHEREFLLDYSEDSIRDGMRKRFTLASINAQLNEFVETQLNASEDYRWAMDACGITQFNPFPAGDMRPLALINLYFSGASLDVCMELADHENMEITYHYIRNIKEVIESSAFMKMQKRINDERKEIVVDEQNLLVEVDNMHYGCNSTKIIRSDISDCDERCIDSEFCVICRHYKATEAEKKAYIEAKKQRLENRINDFQKYIEMYHGDTFDRQIIRFQKACEDYSDACSVMAQQEYEKWKKMRGA